jgi:hypothetical protein
LVVDQHAAEVVATSGSRVSSRAGSGSSIA